jgi:hypothetical protein
MMCSINSRICFFSIGILILNPLNAFENDSLLNQDIPQMSETSLHAEAFENEQSQPITLETFASRGLKFLFTGQFEDALINFNHILNALHDTHKLNKFLLSTALWGRLLCHAYANQEEEAYNDLLFIRSYFIDNVCYSYKESIYANSFSSDNSDYKIFQIADFANPNEKISSVECRSRVRGTANVMRLLVTKIPNRALADAISFTITELEYAASQCCDRSHWTDCLSPIIDSWNYLKNCMDKGVAIAPNLASPGR